MSDGSVERGTKRSEDSLATYQLTVQYKRYYIDVNENSRGRYIKIAELGANYKSRIILSIPAAKAVVAEVAKMLPLIDEPSTEEHAPKESSLIKSETLNVDGRKFYIDLKENDRGRFLRIAQMPTNPRQTRQQIAIPSDGIHEIYKTLADFLVKFGEGHDQESPNAPKVTAENKSFIFHVGKNDRGEFVRISEIKLNSGYRSAITVPMSAMIDFRKELDVIIANQGKQ
uniref:Transcriptional activator protein Pur-alpha n=1 Tax=Caenorhabditis tropicalis TaxID=1561998 RepID=A0A1I7V0M5_9PELO